MYTITRGGCNTRHPISFFVNRPEGSPDYLLLIIKTPGHFIINGIEHRVEPGTGIILSPHIPYYYHNPEGDYIDDWLHFNLHLEDIPFNQNFKANTFFKIKDIDIFSFYLRQILWEYSYSDELYRKENIHYLMKIMMNHLKIAFQQENVSSYYTPYCSQLQNIRINMQNNISNPVTLKECCDKLGISKSHFQHLYSEFFGIPFQKDYIQMRINYTINLLETTDLNMEQIAEFSGYTSEVHFYRQFKAIKQMTPADYRKHFRNKTL